MPCRPPLLWWEPLGMGLGSAHRAAPAPVAQRGARTHADRPWLGTGDLVLSRVGAALPAQPQFKTFPCISPADHPEPPLIPSIELSGGRLCALRSPGGAACVPRPAHSSSTLLPRFPPGLRSSQQQRGSLLTRQDAAVGSALAPAPARVASCPWPFHSLPLSLLVLIGGTGEFALVHDLRREAIRKGVWMGDNSSRKLSALQSIKSAEK